MPEPSTPKFTTILAFDFGMKRIGVAVGQNVTKTAQALTTLSANAGEPKWEQITALIEQWRPDGLVVGIPLNVDSKEQPITHHARHFAECLSQRFNLPVYQMDERFTTIEARQMLFDQGGYKKLKSSEIDSWAAKLILESWFSEQRG